LYSHLILFIKTIY